MGGIPKSVPSTMATGTATSSYSKTIATTAAAGDGKTATIFLAEAPNVSTGDKITVAGITPTAYRVTDALVTYFSDVYPYSVSYRSTATGDQTIAGTVSFTKTVYKAGDWGVVGKAGSGLKTRSQTNVENSLRSQIQSSAGWGGASGTLFQNLDPNLPFPVAFLKALGQGIIRAAIGTVTTVAEVLSAIGSWFGNFVNSAGRIIGNIVNGVIDAAENTVQHFLNFMHHVMGGGRSGVSSATYRPIYTSKSSIASGTARTAFEVAEQAEAVQLATYNTQFATETQSDFWNSPRVLPAWMGNVNDDVSFAQSLIDGTSTPTAGTLVLIPVSASQDRQFDRIKFGIAGTSMTNCYVGLYDADETTGDLTKVDDLGDVKSQLNTSYNLQSVALPNARTVKGRELFYIGILQTGTPSALHRWSATNNFTTGLFPRYIGNTYSTTGIGALPSTISSSQLISGTKYWGSLGMSTPTVAPGSAYYQDSFTRTDSSTLGSSWVVRSGSGLIVSAGSAQAGGTGASINTYVSRAVSTAQEVGAYFYPQPGRGSTTWNMNGMLSLRGNGGGSFMYLRIAAAKYYNVNTGVTTYSTSARLYSATSYTSLGSDFSSGVAKGTQWTSAEDGTGTWTVTAVNSDYTVKLNGTTLFTWTDSGTFPPPPQTLTSAYSEFGIGAANYTRVDNWYGKDL